MKFHKLDSFYIVTDIKEHKELKNNLLKYIEEMPQSNIDDGYVVVSKTDWNISSDYKRDYMNLFFNIIKPYMEEMTCKLKFTGWEIINAWYQVYNKGDKHNWHIHLGTTYANVYYLSLPSKSLSTQLYDPMNDRVIKNIKVKEGQVLTFPAHIIHRSPVNNNDNQKVIISFNTNFMDPELTTTNK